MPETPASRAAQPGDWRRFWVRGTVLAALTLTAFDAGLLQKKKSFFTGGFLTDVHTEGVAGALGFLLTSFLADVAVAGLLAGLAVWLTGRLRLSSPARHTAVFLAAAGPLVIADFLMYELLTYLGDTFDLSLMFDLSGRRPGEVLAVAGQQLIVPTLLVALGTLAAIVTVWAVQRLWPRVAGALPGAWRAGLTAVAAFVVLGSAVTLARAASETADDGLQRKPSGRALAWALELVSDVDRDGYGLGGDFRDPAPFDAQIHPFALDVPGDGVDQDGVAGDLPGDSPAYNEGTGGTARFAHQPNVVFVLLESFRADAIGRTINGRPVTPTLDALAARGISASLAYSHNGYTVQSRFHSLTGSLAGLRGRTSLVDDFKANGYEVGYFSAQDESFGGPAYSVGFSRADVHYDARQDRARRFSSYSTAGSLAVPYTVVLEHVDAFLSARSRAKPLFLYLNFQDSHFPYHHAGVAPLVSDTVLSQSEIVPDNADRVREMYYNAAANVDHAIGEAVARVTRSVGSTPAVIVASDHGESLFDNGFLGHGYALNDAQTRIPLVAAGLPLVVRQPFGQVELRDAIAAALCLPPDVPPRVTTDPAKTVFQYLGKIDRPRQIAATTESGRLIYDFRTDRVWLPGAGAPVHPSTLSGEMSDRFVALVRLWERMVVARAAVGRSDTD